VVRSAGRWAGAVSLGIVLLECKCNLRSSESWDRRIRGEWYNWGWEGGGGKTEKLLDQTVQDCLDLEDRSGSSYEWVTLGGRHVGAWFHRSIPSGPGRRSGAAPRGGGCGEMARGARRERRGLVEVGTGSCRLGKSIPTEFVLDWR